jgi:acyl-CoA synthetase (AMP-forming)/AMP-acid ligase II
MTLLQPDLLAHLAEVFPDGVAWKHMADGEELTIGTWQSRSNRLARGLTELGLIPGERVALAFTEAEPLEWLVSYMAVHKAGGVAVPLTTRLSGPEIMRILRHAEVSVLLGSPVVASRPEVGALVRTVATTGDPASPHLRWHDLLAADDTTVGHRISPDDVADIMYTSGTTGAPKGVLVHHGGLSSTDRVPSSWLGLGFLSSSPFSTTSGSLLVCGPLRGGMSGWFLPSFDPGTWLEIVTTSGPVAAFLVPAMVQLIVAHPDVASADLTSLAVVNIGSAPIASETLRRFGALMPNASVMCGYGMTEFGAVTAMPMGDRGAHLGSVGLPLPGVEVRILNPAGDAVPDGDVAQVVVRSTRTRRSYLGDDESAGATWHDGWLQTGDLGHLDPDGFLWIVGRQKEMIIRGGHNIVPGEVEAAFFEHPAVVEAAVTGVPHGVLGEDVAAWVVLRPNDRPSVAALRAFLLERLADYKVPRRITVVDALPRNAAGKVLKSLLMPDDEPRSAP